MKKLIASIGVAAALGGGAFALNTVMPAGAQTSSNGPAAEADCRPASPRDVLHDALDKLVADGTITQAQEDTILQTVRDTAQDEGYPRHHRRAKLLHGTIETAADAIGVSVDDLTAALQSGESIADVATAHDVDPQTVVDALVTAGTQRLDEAVANGGLSQERADKVKERLPEIADRVVHRTPKPPCEDTNS